MIRIEGPEIVDAVRVVGVRMGHQDAVEPLDAGLDQLLAQIGRRVDEDSGRAAGPEALEEHRAAAAAILGFVGSHAPQPCPTRGTPADEPQPRMVRRRLNATVRPTTRAWEKR